MESTIEEVQLKRDPAPHDRIGPSQRLNISPLAGSRKGNEP